MRYGVFVIAMLAMLALDWPQGRAETQGESGSERAVQLSEVPRVALDAARKALRTTPTEARLKIIDGRQVYRVEGTNVYYKKISVEVAADGTLLKPVDIWQDDDD